MIDGADTYQGLFSTLKKTIMLVAGGCLLGINK
jgi:hypothetical protein